LDQESLLLVSPLIQVYHLIIWLWAAVALEQAMVAVALADLEQTL
jgi:hypothetical protein